MNQISPARLWGMRMIFALLICMLLFFRLLPLDMTPNIWVGPDLLLAFALAWSLRRPEYVPMLGLAVLFLIADLLLQRPPGLWALCALLACERLKSRARTVSEASFAGEWIAAAMAILAVAAGYRLGLVLTLVPPPPLGLALLEVVITIAFYPVAAALTHWAMGVRRPAPGDMNKFGTSGP